MVIIELKEEHYVKFIECIVESFSLEYLPLGIKKENAKSNGCFFTKSHLYNYMNKGVKFYIMLDAESIIGGVGILEKDDYCKIKKLFVSTKVQNQGFGKILMEFVEEYTRKVSKNKIKLGMIYENKKLYEFYIKLGYQDKKISYNKKMNLNIAFMEKII